MTEADLKELVIKGKHFLLSPIVAEEILELRKQDKVHWKTRRTLLAYLKNSEERINYLKGCVSDLKFALEKHPRKPRICRHCGGVHPSHGPCTRV